MSDPSEDEPPLDPVLLRVQSRLRRLMIIGGLTLGIGIFAVLAAVVYRITMADSTPDPIADSTVVALAATALGLGLGAELISVSLAGDEMALGFRDGVDTAIVTIDRRSMSVIDRVRIENR